MSNLHDLGGWMRCARVRLETPDPNDAQDHIIFAGFAAVQGTDEGTFDLSADRCRRLFDLDSGYETHPGQALLEGMSEAQRQRMEGLLVSEQDALIQKVQDKSTKWLDAESTKLDRWAEDRKLALEEELKDLDRLITETRRESLSAQLLPQKVALQQTLRDFEAARTAKRRELFEAQDRVAVERDTMISAMQKQLMQRVEVEPLFTIKWSVV